MEFSQQPVIFVVEDNLIYQNLIAKELESVSRNIHFYTNGESCLEELDKGPSVIVMDYNLDGKLNGLDTLQQVRNINPDVYVILFSSQKGLNTKEVFLQYGSFDFLEKNTNSGLNTFERRSQQVLLANTYLQDFFFPGYTAEFLIAYNKDDGGLHYDDNGFLVRPSPVGNVINQNPGIGAILHGIRVGYFGWLGSGHIKRFNLTHAFFQAVGEDTFNPIAGKRVTVNAQMAAAEFSYDHNWIRYRVSGFYASGDANPRDGRARGFDSILDLPSFAGGLFSFWNREQIRLTGSGVSLTPPGSLLPSLRSNKEEGQANFVNPGIFLANAGADFDITPKLHVEAGTVHFHSTFHTSIYGGYWFTPQSASVYGGSSAKWNSKAGISYKPLDGLLVYADWAQGFRDGGVNGGIPSSCTAAGVPAQFTPDTLTNWELGWKSTMFDRHLQWNGAAYYMPWKNLQSLLFDPGICPSSSFNANIGDARVYGMESDIKYQANAFLSMELSASYNDSRISTNKFQNQYFQVQPGERLPYVPYFNWSYNARYQAPIKDALHGYVQYDVSHKGDMWNTLQSNGSNGLPHVLQPGYSVMNLRFGLNQTEERWMSELYITNLLNKNAVIYTNEGNFDLRQTVNEPRVFGVRVSYRWGKSKGGE